MSGDVLVIGAGPAGLAAAAYMARAGAHVLLLEAADAPGGSCANHLTVGGQAVPAGPHTLAALDPRVIKDLKLSRLGLRFDLRDLPLVGLRADGKALELGHDVHEATRAIAPMSQRDAERYPDFRRRLFDFARTMRAVWWEEGGLERETDRGELGRLSVTPAGALLEAMFESEAMKAAFAFDTMAGGLSPYAAGSALALVWQAAQEMCGLQGAHAIPHGGPAAVADVLFKAATREGVEVRTGAKVTGILLENDAVSGVTLAKGDVIRADTVFSSLSRRTTLLDFLPPGAAGFATAREIEPAPDVGEGKLVLALNALPLTFKQPARYVIAERLDNAMAAHAEARAGRVPRELALEAIMLDTGREPPFLLSVMARPLPARAGDPKAFVTAMMQAVLRTLERHAPEIRANISGFVLQPPAAFDPLTVRHMTASWRERIVTPVRGLYLCGQAVEPVPAVSCRAARIAAAIATADLKRRRA